MLLNFYKKHKNVFTSMDRRSKVSYKHLVFTRESSYILLSARLNHRNSVCPSVRPSVTRVDYAKTVQARITKSSPSAAWKTLVSGTVKLFHKFKGGRSERGR